MEHSLAAGEPAGLAFWLEQSAVGALMRQSLWLYPVVSIAHILGVGLLLGSIVAFDLRVLGLGRQLPLVATAGHLLPIAALGVAVQIPTGALMLTADATALLANPVLLAKLTLVALGLVNIALFHRIAGWGLDRLRDPPAATLRVSAALSLGLWLTIAVLGRLIAYV